MYGVWPLPNLNIQEPSGLRGWVWPFLALPTRQCAFQPPHDPTEATGDGITGVGCLRRGGGLGERLRKQAVLEKVCRVFLVSDVYGMRRRRCVGSDCRRVIGNRVGTCEMHKSERSASNDDNKQ